MSSSLGSSGQILETVSPLKAYPVLLNGLLLYWYIHRYYFIWSGYSPCASEPCAQERLNEMRQLIGKRFERKVYPQAGYRQYAT